MIMKRLLILLCCMAATGAYAQGDFCGLHNTAFKEGEQLYFKVWYNMGRVWVGAGEATFTTSLEEMGNHRVYHIVGDGKTLKSYEWFYKVRDRYETFIDAATMLPMKFVRNVNEGGFKIYNSVTFNQKVGQAVSTGG